jgi:heme/copper-type cytochrome/quinol oxidase subunit 1
LWGVQASDASTLPVAGLGVLGVVLVSLGNLVAGAVDQPAGAVDGFAYDGPRGLWNVLVAGGHALMALTVVMVALALVGAVRKNQRASDDPWNGHTLEWSVPSPAPRDNFEVLATVGSAEPVLDAKPAQEVKA